MDQEDHKNNPSRIMRAMHGRAIVKLTMLRKIAAIGKLRVATERYVKTWFDKKRRPLIIFAYHTPIINGIIAICRKLGLKIASIRGNDNDQTRQDEVNKFQNGEADVFIASIKSAGAGINLQRASDMLCLERLRTPMLMEQAESRCHRIGQNRKVTITYMDAVGTVVLTGRNARPALLERADLVTEMVKRKHYFDEGVPARKGTED